MTAYELFNIQKWKKMTALLKIPESETDPVCSLPSHESEKEDHSFVDWNSTIDTDSNYSVGYNFEMWHHCPHDKNGDLKHYKCSQKSAFKCKYHLQP